MSSHVWGSIHGAQRVASRRTRYRLVALTLLAATGLAGFKANAADLVASATPLTLDQALQLAQSRSRQLAAQDSATVAARQMALAAGQRPDPILKFGINNLPVDGPDRYSLTRDFMTMQSVGVMQEFTREDKRVARANRLEREAEAGEAGRAVALATLQRDTAVAWLDRYYQERMVALLQSQRDEVRLQVEAAEVGYRGGRGLQADVFAARAALAQMEDRIAQAELQVSTARTTLSRWVGEAADRPLGALPGTDTVSLHHANLADQLGGHPDIVLMAKQEEMAQADAEIARANKRADWSAEFMVSHRPSYSNMVSFNVSVPLQWDQHDRQDRELAAKLALADQMRAQREEATREHLAQTQTTLQAWQSGRERLARYDSTLIPLAAERTQATLAAYRGGTAPLNAVLEARRMDIDTRMERLRLEMETARLWAQLNFLIPADRDLASPGPRP